MTKIILQIQCKDRKGIIAAISNFFLNADGNVIYVDQYVDTINNSFFLRLECEFDNGISIDEIEAGFAKNIATAFEMSWKLFTKEHKPRMALFVSKYEHCLFDILARYSANELNVDIPIIISNHNDLKPVAERFNIPFYYVPFTKEIKAEGEKAQLTLLKEHNIDFIVLARYMQIITPALIAEYQNEIINIHHSFLPAFPGAKPYHSAFSRGVKIIGATSHYVTEELDEGPIIEQDTIRVSHIHSIEDFILKGKDLERLVLSRAIKLHAERKTMVHGNKTIIFS